VERNLFTLAVAGCLLLSFCTIAGAEDLPQTNIKETLIKAGRDKYCHAWSKFVAFGAFKRLNDVPGLVKFVSQEEDMKLRALPAPDNNAIYVNETGLSPDDRGWLGTALLTGWVWMNSALQEVGTSELDPNDVREYFDDFCHDHPEI
jgi:hypothetical protein